MDQNIYDAYQQCCQEKRSDAGNMKLREKDVGCLQDRHVDAYDQESEGEQNEGTQDKFQDRLQEEINNAERQTDDNQSRKSAFKRHAFNISGSDEYPKDIADNKGDQSHCF